MNDEVPTRDGRLAETACGSVRSHPPEGMPQGIINRRLEG